MIRRLSVPFLVVVIALGSAFAQDAKSQTLSIFGVQFTFPDTLNWKMTDLGTSGFMSPEKGNAMVLFLQSKDKQCANAINVKESVIASPFTDGWFPIATLTADKTLNTCIESPKGTYLAKVTGVDRNDPDFQGVKAALNALGKALASAPAPVGTAAPVASESTLQTIQVLGVQFQVNDSIRWKSGQYNGSDYVMNEAGDLAVVLMTSPVRNCGKVMDRLGGKVENNRGDGWYKTASIRSKSLNLCIEGPKDTYLATIQADVLNSPGAKNLSNVLTAFAKAVK